MNRGIYALILPCFICSSVGAQVHTGDSIHYRKNSVYLELDRFDAYSVNYDHVFDLTKKPTSDFSYLGLGLRVGFAYFDDIFLPIEGYLTYGNKFNIELGVRNTSTYDLDFRPFDYQTLRFGGKWRGRQGLILFLGGKLPFGTRNVFLYLGFGYSF